MKIYLYLTAITLFFLSCEVKQEQEIKELKVESKQEKINYATCFDIIEEAGIKKLIIKNPFEDYAPQQIFVLLKKEMTIRQKKMKQFYMFRYKK